MQFCDKCKIVLPGDVSFCSKCGNKLQSKQNELGSQATQVEEDSKVPFFERLLNWLEDCGGVAWKISMIFFSINCFLIGGWDIGKAVVWGSYRNKNFIFDEKFGVVFKFNDGYYGLFFEDRFFNSPFISWFLLGISLFLFGAFFKMIFKAIFGDEGD